MTKLKVGQRLVLRANDRTTVVVRRFRPGPESASRIALEVHDARFEVFDRPPGYPVDRRGRTIPPVATVNFDDEQRAHELARAIGAR